jgi:deoxyribodipyrimidine photo-lyase
VLALAAEAGAGLVTWNRRYEKAAQAVDAALKTALKANGREVQSFQAHLLYEPWAVKSKTGGPVRVFTPFWKAALATGEPRAPHAAPAHLPAGPAVTGIAIDDLGFEPKAPDWASRFGDVFTPGEAGAQAALERFLNGGARGYAEDRNRPDLPSTSRLSPHLRFGEIGINRVWHTVRDAEAAGRVNAHDATKFLAELGWREFSYHLLDIQPDLATRNFQPRFDAFPWVAAEDERTRKALRAWQKGQTGYPIVDAGMRELWQTGWMHNRVRMIVGSFLVKHLLIDWRAGERWFWDTLVDADAGNNAASWQWVAGSGADAAPYFRIFNPVSQGQKFDPDGAYVKRFVPELARVPASVIHEPWDAPRDVLRAAGVTLGVTYPHPVIDHIEGRNRALAAFEALSERSTGASAA